MDGLEGMQISKIDLRYADETVIFTICDCSLDKDYSFYKLSREQSERFLSRLKHFENMTWRQLSGLERENGLTVESCESKSYEMIDQQNTSDQITEKNYFHLRIEPRGLFRLFGYQKERFFCITHIDRGGIIHH